MVISGECSIATTSTMSDCTGPFDDGYTEALNGNVSCYPGGEWIDGCNIKRTGKKSRILDRKY